MKKIYFLLTLFFLSAYALTGQDKQSPDLPSGIPEDNPKELPKSQEKKPEFGLSQSIANDVFVLGNSLFGERLSRRNNESYGGF